MANKKEIDVVLVYEAKTQESGVLVSNEFANNERTMRAVKALLSMWGLALVTLFIPLAHFFLVPGFLIAGPVVAYSKYTTQRTSECVKGICPACKENITINVEAKEYPPIWTYCPECRNPLEIRANRP